MRNLNPAYKLAGVLAPIVILAFFYHIALNFAVVAACLAVLAFSRVNWKTAAKIMLPVCLLAFGMYMAGVRFQAGSNIGVGAGAGLVTDDAVANGLQLASRVLAFSCLGLLFVLTTDPMQLVRSLEQQLRLPVKFVYGLLAALQLLPNLSREWNKTRAAFYARGRYPFAASPALLVPMMVKAVRWSEALAAAMESKGFDDEGRRTCLRPLRVRAADRVFPFATCGLLALGLVIL